MSYKTIKSVYVTVVVLAVSMGFGINYINGFFEEVEEPISKYADVLCVNNQISCANYQRKYNRSESILIPTLKILEEERGIEKKSERKTIPDNSLGCEEERYIFEKYDWPVEIAMNVCRVESGGKETASNWADSHKTCKGSHGLMQIGCLHGKSVEELYKPEVNIEIAYNLWKQYGWSPWKNTCKKIKCT